MVVVFNNN